MYCRAEEAFSSIRYELIVFFFESESLKTKKFIIFMFENKDFSPVLQSVYVKVHNPTVEKNHVRGSTSQRSQLFASLHPHSISFEVHPLYVA